MNCPKCNQSMKEMMNCMCGTSPVYHCNKCDCIVEIDGHSKPVGQCWEGTWLEYIEKMLPEPRDEFSEQILKELRNKP